MLLNLYFLSFFKNILAYGLFHADCLYKANFPVTSKSIDSSEKQ